jgi:DNA-3-methyladenine glycosylase
MMGDKMRLDRSYFCQDVLTVSEDLLGKVLNMKIDGELKRYRIVETEAYCGLRDKASHAYLNKRTKRTDVMFKEGGVIYVYLIYGMYHCLNIVVNHLDVPQAILIRAVEPLDQGEIRLKKDIKTNGPGKLCKHLGIDMSYNQVDLTTSNSIYITDEGYKPEEIIKGKRINIDYAEEAIDFPWRFYIKGNRFVSKT